MRLAPILALSLLLTACGDDAPRPASGSGALPGMPKGLGDGSKPVSPEDLAEAMRRGGGDPKAAAREMEAALKERMGSNILEDAQKAKALNDRPLSASDVETYIATVPLTRMASKDLPGWQSALAAKGLSLMEWSVLGGRIMQARTQLRIQSEKANAKVKADAETVRPFVDRIDAALKGR